MQELTTFSFPCMDACEEPLWAASRLAMDQSAQLHAGELQPKEGMVRAIASLLSSAVAPLRRKLGNVCTERLTEAEHGVRHQRIGGPAPAARKRRR